MKNCKKLAFVTQSYKDDYKECALLCESIDRFVPREMDHFIFVNDEDYKMFLTLNYSQHHVYKKSTILPWFLYRFPFKMFGHHYHCSPITIPVREWIIQQICKLGVFEVIGEEYEAVFNIDSESIFMRPFVYERLIKEGKYLMYKSLRQCEPNFMEYCKEARRLLHLNKDIEEISRYNYMSTPVCFVRENLINMLATISNHSNWGNWKIALCNTYRFSENYLYGIYTDNVLGGKNHFSMDKYLFPLIDLASLHDSEDLENRIYLHLSSTEIMGVLLQKTSRKNMTNLYLNFEVVKRTIYEIWNSK